MLENYMEMYYKQLEEAGFLRSTEHFSSYTRFYREMQEYTAFVVNTGKIEGGVRVVYGAASTAFTKLKGCEDLLERMGVDSTDIALRDVAIITSEAEAKAAAERIARLYEATKQYSKDELLKAANEKRKMFASRFAAVLKPLGFTKKALTWTKKLENGYDLSFNLQKSGYSDTYYFNVYIAPGKCIGQYGSCFYTRINPAGEDTPLDWQLTEEEKLADFIKCDTVEYLSRLISTPLSELGKKYEIWQRCACKRNKCENCWVEKNLWEAKGEE